MIAALVLVSLVLVSLVVSFARGEPEARNADTPEGVVQRYSTAVVSGDETSALTYLTPEVQNTCERFSDLQVDNLRVCVIATTERSTSADVRVSIVNNYGGNGSFGASECASERTFDLVLVDGQWRSEGSPWELAVCSHAARN